LLSKKIEKKTGQKECNSIYLFRKKREEEK
jgi:hypothetical protein